MNIPDLSEIPDLEPAPEGEYNLKIVSCRETTSGNTGREGYKMVIHNQDGDNFLPIFHSIWFPMESDDDSKVATMWRMVKEFLTSIGLPPGDVGPEDIQGMEFTGMIGIRNNDLSGQPENHLIRATGN